MSVQLADEPAIADTRHWIETVVIAHNFCPFAKRALRADAVHFAVLPSEDVAELLHGLMAHCQQLDADAGIETSLLIIPNALADFDDYLDVLALAEDLMAEQGYEGVYQLASFHPAYCFADAEPDDPANYTNRSPYPMLHLLREAELEKAIASHPNSEAIPETNMALARAKGLAYWQALCMRRQGQA